MGSTQGAPNLQFITWPTLEFGDWQESLQTLHRWLQLVGKIKLCKAPWINHSWQSALHLTPRGLTTSLVHDADQTFSINFDFVDHFLQMETSDGRLVQFPLSSESVAVFHDRCLNALRSLGIEADFCEIPNELPDATPFYRDNEHRSYDPENTHRFLQILLQVERVMQIFRSRFVGKVSPIHFFWGSMDLAVTRFSGRRAPAHPGGVPHLPDLVTRDAYSHEVSSCGFWPGSAPLYPHAAFYSYAYPTPSGFSTVKVEPQGAFWHDEMKEFVLPYQIVRESNHPEWMLLDFFQSTYRAAATLGHWDRKLLEDSEYLQALQKTYGPN